MNGTITDVPGIRVGHAGDPDGLTGCTVVLCEAGAAGGVDQRGGAPGTRETDLLRPLHLVEAVHAIVLAGGSAFGLAAADGVMRYLAGRGVGFDAGPARVPVVPAAVLFDLGLGRANAWPDAEMGYRACLEAGDEPVAQGNVGAGLGCSAGKALGMDHATKTGLGSASIDLGGGLVVAALVAANPLGDILDENGQILAGTRAADGAGFANTLALLRVATSAPAEDWSQAGNTVIGVIATNARLNREQVNKVAQMAQDGLARAVRPSHTMVDGDTIFGLATGAVPADVNLIGAYAAEVMAEAIRRSARTASAAGGLPAGAAVLARAAGR
jgi:L-aminopeptidase/D-esterase-like protein